MGKFWTDRKKEVAESRGTFLKTFNRSGSVQLQPDLLSSQSTGLMQHLAALQLLMFSRSVSEGGRAREREIE